MNVVSDQTIELYERSLEYKNREIQLAQAIVRKNLHEVEVIRKRQNVTFQILKSRLRTHSNSSPRIKFLRVGHLMQNLKAQKTEIEQANKMKLEIEKRLGILNRSEQALLSRKNKVGEIQLLQYRKGELRKNSRSSEETIECALHQSEYEKSTESFEDIPVRPEALSFLVRDVGAPQNCFARNDFVQSFIPNIKNSNSEMEERRFLHEFTDEESSEESRKASLETQCLESQEINFEFKTDLGQEILINATKDDHDSIRMCLKSIPSRATQRLKSETDNMKIKAVTYGIAISSIQVIEENE